MILILLVINDQKKKNQHSKIQDFFPGECFLIVDLIKFYPVYQ